MNRGSGSQLARGLKLDIFYIAFKLTNIKTLKCMKHVQDVYFILSWFYY